MEGWREGWRNGGRDGGRDRGTGGTVEATRRCEWGREGGADHEAESALVLPCYVGGRRQEKGAGEEGMGRLCNGEVTSTGHAGLGQVGGGGRASSASRSFEREASMLNHLMLKPRRCLLSRRLRSCPCLSPRMCVSLCATACPHVVPRTTHVRRCEPSCLCVPPRLPSCLCVPPCLFYIRLPYVCHVCACEYGTRACMCTEGRAPVACAQGGAPLVCAKAGMNLCVLLVRVCGNGFMDGIYAVRMGMELCGQTG